MIHHGGIGTTELALAVGRPQLLLPRYPEQVLTALAVNALGGSAFLSGRHPPDHLSPLLEWLTQNPAAARQAGDYAQALHQEFAAGSLPALVDLCRRLAHGSPG